MFSALLTAPICLAVPKCSFTQTRCWDPEGRGHTDCWPVLPIWHATSQKGTRNGFSEAEAGEDE